MANEINVSIAIAASKNNVSVSASSAKYNDMSGADMLAATQSIGTSAEAIKIDGNGGFAAGVVIMAGASNGGGYHAECSRCGCAFFVRR